MNEECPRKDYYHLTAVGECLDASLSRMLSDGSINGNVAEEIKVSVSVLISPHSSALEAEETCK